VNQRRYAVSSALAASALPSLVLARGHRISNVPELPLVLADSLNRVSRTKDAKAILEKVGAFEDVEKSRDSKKIHKGVGKSRNRRYTQRRGPLLVYDVSEGDFSFNFQFFIQIFSFFILVCFLCQFIHCLIDFFIQ
jgi:large subunit ribosomal protein L4e